MDKSNMNLVLLVIVFQLLLGMTLLFPQEWSSEQKEAWATVEKMFDFWAKRDLEGYMNCLHPNFVGWFHNDPLPLDKKSLRNWESLWLSTEKIHRYEIKPVSIKITSDVAVVSYYDTTLREDEKEKNLGYSKWTDVLLKENGKWLILSSVGARLEND